MKAVNSNPEPAHGDRLQTIVGQLLTEIDRIVDRSIEQKLPNIMRSLGLGPRAIEEPDEDLVGALEVAKYLGFDVSTAKKIRLAKQRVYNLAAKNRIPSIRLGEKSYRFDLNAVQRKLNGGHGD